MINANDAVEELITIGDLVRWGTSCFCEAELVFGHGTDNALDEAFALVRYSLHLPHEIPPYMILTRLTKSERRRVVNLLMERISSRKPAPYLIQEAWFAGMPFYVDERVLIPRSPIAELIGHGFAPWIDPDNVATILDLCTGCGCIAIACAEQFPDAKVTATDTDPLALEVAALNVEKHQQKTQVTLLQSDVFEQLPVGQTFDIIVSNPPYVDADDMAALAVEFQHEPLHALAAGKDGLDIVERILRRASDYLTPQGILVVEVGNSADALMLQFPDLAFNWPDFQHGGHGVFILTRQELLDHTTSG